MVHTFIALAALAIGATAYFGLTFTPADAILCGVVAGAVMIVLLERTLRQRAEARAEKAIADLAQLLATDTQAGAILGQRVNALADLNAGNRLDHVEADISVLGTVIRQVAEAVAEMEQRQQAAAVPQRSSSVLPPVEVHEPSVPLDVVREAVDENRLIYQVQPVVTLPQRRIQGYDLVPRLELETGRFVDREEYLPLRGAEDVRRHIDAMGLMEAVTLGRRARNAGQTMTLYVPLSRATLADEVAAEQMMISLEANRAIAGGLTFVMEEGEWQGLTTAERAAADTITRKGAGFSLAGVTSLRIDIADLAVRGVRSLRVDARRFLASPQSFTDFHPSDIADYIGRFEVALLATGIAAETEIIELLEDRILLVQGPHIGGPGPIRPDLMLEPSRQPQLRRAER